MHLEIISPQKTVAKIDNVIKIIAPTVEGEITILSNHQNMVGVISMGEILAETSDNSIHKYYVDRGVFKIISDKVTFLSDNAESDSKSIRDEIQQAIDRAEANISVESSMSYEVLAKLEKQLRFQRFVREKINS